MKRFISMTDLEIKLADFKGQEMEILPLDTSSKDIAKILVNKSVVTIPVGDSGKVEGVIRLDKFLVSFSRRLLANSNDDHYAKDFILKKFPRLTTENNLYDLLETMFLRNSPALPIFDHKNGNYVKSITFNEVFDWIINKIKSYFQDVKYLSDWDYDDTNIIDKSFFKLKKGSIGEDFFLDNLKKVESRGHFNLSSDNYFHEFIENVSEYKKSFWVGSLSEHETKLTGILCAKDILKEIIQRDYNLSSNLRMGEFKQSPYSLFMKKHSLDVVLKHLLENNYGFLVIVDEDRYPIDIINKFDLVNYITKTIFLFSEEKSHLKEVA